MIMVRRRARPAKEAVAAISSHQDNITINGDEVVPAAAIANAANLLEDQYFASPKRKDCRLMQINENLVAGPIALGDEKYAPQNNNANGAKHKTAGKTKSERSGSAGRNIGVPLATRSQTRTIENFFKAKAAANNTKMTENENVMQKTISSNISESNTSSPETVTEEGLDDDHEFLHEEEDIYHESSPTPPPYTLIGEDSNDTTNDSTQSTQNTLNPVNGSATHGDFQTHRSTLRDSHSSHGSSCSNTENIFLQEPVLKLDIDKSPNQASSIKINKSFEVGAIFSSPPALTACVLNGRFNQIVTLNGGNSPAKRESFTYEYRPHIAAPLNNGFALEHDSSSCDSGVAFVANTAAVGTTANGLTSQQFTDASPVAQTRRRKPATPHRILCPSPIKTMPRDPILNGLPITGARKVAAVIKDTLSPRKSQRQLNGVVTCKSRRRLNQPNKEQAPYKTHTTVDSDRRRQQQSANIVIVDTVDDDDEDYDSNAASGDNVTVAQQHIHDNDTVVIDEEEFENVGSCASNNSNVPHMMTNATNIDNNTGFNGKTKSILNSAKHPTARQNTTNNNHTNTNNNKHTNNNTKLEQQNSKSNTAKGAKPKTNSIMISNNIKSTACSSNSNSNSNISNNIVGRTTTTTTKKTTNFNNTNTNQKTQYPLTATNGNRELTDFFPVRRSVRKTKTAVKEEMMRNLEQAVLEERAEGLKIAYFEGKGRGIIADRHFKRGEFVIEYIGDLISMTEAAEREKRYALDENAGCYMYYFKHKNQQYCIDATIDTGKLGRLVNHSRNGNLVTKVVVVKQRPHLVLLAKEEIEPGEELCYDYGDRSKESLLHHPWLAF